MKLARLNRLFSKKIILVFCILALVIFGYRYFTSRSKTEDLKTTHVKRQNLKSTVAASGSLNGRESVNLKFKSFGRLASLNFKVGDSVQKGTVVANLDTQDLAIALQQAQNDFRSKQAAAEKAEDDVKDHKNDETFTQKQIRTTAQAARDSAFDAVKQAQRAFQDAILTAPISGTITKADPVPGQFVSASDTIAQIVDWSKVNFEADVDEADISKISIGQPAEITLDSYPDQKFTGTVSEILPQTKTTSSGATVVTVKIDLGLPAIHFISGLNGQTTITSSEVTNVLTIPQEALKDDNTVLVQTPNGPHSVKVVTGLSSDTDIEITSGLKENDTIITNPQSVTPRSSNQLFRFFSFRRVSR